MNFKEIVFGLIAMLVAQSAYSDEVVREVYSCSQTRTTSFALTLIWPDENSDEPDLLIEERKLGESREIVRLSKPDAEKDGNSIFFDYFVDEENYAKLSIVEKVENSPIFGETITYVGTFDVQLPNVDFQFPETTFCTKLF